MSILQLATVLIYVTAVLTSTTVNENLKTDENQSPALKKLLESSPNVSKNPNLSTETSKTRSINNTGSDTVIVNSENVNQIITEGGPIQNSRENGGTKSSKKSGNIDKDKLIPIKKFESNFPENDPELDRHEKLSSTVARKGVDEEVKKTVGRKGVGNPKDEPFDNEKLNQQQTADDLKSAETTPNIMKKNSTELPVSNAERILSPNEKTEDEKTDSNDTKMKEKVEVIDKKHSNATVIVVPAHPSSTSKSPKPKPLFTTGEGDDEEMPSFQKKKEKQTDMGMPRKVDYIIPVVITIMAVPILGIAAFVLYTRGRDCWDKRHYRRMDFLIDGMYND